MSLPKILTAIFLVIFLVFGIWVASRKALWNDEYYSLVSSTLGRSYGDIVTGKVSEGNNSPLFYLLQKIQCDMFRYRPPQAWIEGHWGGVHRYDQVFLRLQPVACTAAGLALLFLFFYTRYSLLAGIYALGVGLSSYMVWVHWAEARPYSLWWCLSLVQALLLLKYWENLGRDKGRYLSMLAGTHVLLSLTTTISILQLLTASLLLWCLGMREVRRYVWLIVIPAVICVFYYAQAPKYDFYFVNGPMSLINANIPKDRLLVIAGFLAFCFFKWRGKKMADIAGVWPYGLFTLGLLCLNGILLVKLKLSQHEPGFQVSNRYFMVLTAVGTVATALFSIHLYRAVKRPVVKAMLGMVFMALLLFRFHASFGLIIQKVLLGDPS